MTEQSPGTPVPQGSYCTRCGDAIPIECFPQYMRADHLCSKCEGISDSEVWTERVERDREIIRASGLVKGGNGRG